MNDVEAGKINCIITKDLSRFGREHVMMDYYLEFVFPKSKFAISLPPRLPRNWLWQKFPHPAELSAVRDVCSHIRR